MEMLPPEKRPVAGTEAAKERRRQLEQQLPLYDMDENERCENLPPEELENFLKYLDVLRKTVAGQAIVQEILPKIPKEIISFKFPSAIEKGSQISHNNVPKPYQGNIVISKHPEVSYPKREILNGVQKNDGVSSSMEQLSLGNQPQPKIPVNPTETEFPYQPLTSAHYKPPPSEFAVPRNYENSEDSPRKKGIHNSINDQQYYPSKSAAENQFLGIKNLAGPKPYIVKSVEQNIVPGQYSTNLSSMKAQIPGMQQTYRSPYDQYANHADDKGNIPKMFDSNAHVVNPNVMQVPYNAQRSPIKDPKYYAESSNVNILFPNESQILQRDPKKWNHELEMSQFFCQYCQNLMRPGDVAVICERAGPGKYWHPKCFVCVTCKELLADLIYFYKDGKVYCGRHYTQAADIPRCKACDELIFGETWTRADDFDWHIHHYCCFICDKPLAGMKYIPDEKGFPHCLSCYMSFKAKMCETCENKISPDQTRAGFRGYFYHAKPECFCCYSCRNSMIGQKFKMVKNWVFCSQDCINAAQQDILMNPNPKEK